MKPRIAIPVPTISDLDYNQRSWPNYAESVRQAGGEPVEIALGLPASELEEQAASCDGFCLPGSPADVNPELFGAEIDPASSPADLAREACDFHLLEHAEKLGKPVLAICFGLQSLNVWRGGSLLQDLMPLPVNHAAGAKVAVAHSILVPESSLLGSLLHVQAAEAAAEAPLEDGYFRLPVNSSHHQAIASPGDGLRVVARCPEDGVIEAVENDPAYPRAELANGRPQFVLGVQWHPERSYGISPASQALFARLIAEAVAFAAGQPL